VTGRAILAPTVLAALVVVAAPIALLGASRRRVRAEGQRDHDELQASEVLGSAGKYDVALRLFDSGALRAEIALTPQPCRPASRTARAPRSAPVTDPRSSGGS
jgi:hypothetical protein